MDKPYAEHTKCLISNSTELKVIKGYEKHYLVKSKPAGFVFSSRIPTQEELINYYSRYGSHTHNSEMTKARYRELLEGFEPYRKTNNILDLGCGMGFFLEEAKAKGWNVYGTEFSDNAVEGGRKIGVNMSKAPITTDTFANEMFDVITSFEVIEHINNPLEEIKIIQNILRSGGMMYVTTPNYNAIERILLKDRYDIFEYPEHLCFYTPKTLNYLFTHNGFIKKRIITTGISISRIKLLFKKTNATGIINPDMSTDESVRETIQSNKVFAVGKQFVNTMLNFLGCGNALKGWFVKK